MSYDEKVHEKLKRQAIQSGLDLDKPIFQFTIEDALLFLSEYYGEDIILSLDNSQLKALIDLLDKGSEDINWEEPLQEVLSTIDNIICNGV